MSITTSVIWGEGERNKGIKIMRVFFVCKGLVLAMAHLPSYAYKYTMSTVIFCKELVSGLLLASFETHPSISIKHYTTGAKNYIQKQNWTRLNAVYKLQQEDRRPTR